MTRGGFFIAILVSALGSGCVIIPTTEHVPVVGPTRGLIDQETLESIRVGVTTREEVLLRLGEPDVVMRNERLFAYHWVTNTGYVIGGGGATGSITGGGGVGAIRQKRYLALVEFDEQGIVKRHEVKEGWLFYRRSYDIGPWLNDMERW